MVLASRSKAAAVTRVGGRGLDQPSSRGPRRVDQTSLTGGDEAGEGVRDDPLGPSLSPPGQE